MKITPLDIQHKVFETQWRGYHKTQVDQFLEEIAESVEELTKENLVLKEKLSGKDDEVGQLKRAENTLTSTLISTQSFVDQLKHGAQRDADLLVKEAELKAEEILAQSRAELADMRRMISTLKQQRALVLDRLRLTLSSFHRLVEIEERPEASFEGNGESEMSDERASHREAG
ncbi:MAG: DivIVA domain-containing protein [Nitrospirales bacterium]|nr:DivIVA domain-containing protein [Nitrospira sp.]MDR4459778.1 DivIVA domain-containing protein [Nitrospirales bacterium]